MSATFPGSARLRRRREYLAIQRGGRKHHCENFLVFVVHDETAPTRIGITVTKKVGNAVVRNRIKRFVREAYRRARPRFEPGTQMVWVAKHRAAKAAAHDVAADVERIADRLRPRTSPDEVEAR